MVGDDSRAARSYFGVEILDKGAFKQYFHIYTKGWFMPWEHLRYGVDGVMNYLNYSPSYLLATTISLILSNFYECFFFFFEF